MMMLLLLIKLLPSGDVGPAIVAYVAAPTQKPHEKRSSSRNPCRLGRTSPRRHCPFSSSNSVIIADPNII